ncbi:glycerophosphodiester phosphodiesterase family protein [Thermococcus sp.]|uniref:glycerophosphodiester phosphodiesterase family protein n=1 Tax=Thermococcus sp. TaxID=35749 RepID=UPI002626C344|nr:glycerophosphodiester phosphodiesterase family protein [Thermococcus sp.]
MYSEKILILGHRGFKGPLENTLPAFRRTLRYAEGMEFDVRMTGDGKLITHHDPGFYAGGSFHLVGELSLRELRRLHPLGRLIPTVKGVLDEFKGAIFNADVKEELALKPLLGAVESSDLLERTVFSSENPQIVEALLRECPDCRVGFSITGYKAVFRIPKFRNLYSVHVPLDAVSYVGYRALLTLLRALRKRGLRVYLWNYRMNELEWVPRLWRFADAVISDDPARLKKSFYG